MVTETISGEMDQEYHENHDAHVHFSKADCFKEIVVLCSHGKPCINPFCKDGLLTEPPIAMGLPCTECKEENK